MKSRISLLLTIVMATFPPLVLLLGGCGGMSHDMMAPSLRITTQDAPSGVTSVQYNGKTGFTLAASGGTPPYKWSWALAPSSSLPPGLRLHANSISGTPQSSGDFRAVITVTDSGHPAAQASATYTVAIDAPLAINSGQPPSGTVGTGYGPIGTIYLKCVWSSTGGVHQACTRCDPSISGSCPANRTNCNYPNTCTKTVQGHAGFQFTATGGAAPYTWTGTNLPPGLGLYPKFGIMSGTPTTAATYSITVTAKDSEPTPQQVHAKYSVTISPSSTPKYVLTGICQGVRGQSSRNACAQAGSAACPVGAPAKTPEPFNYCVITNPLPVWDTSRECTVVYGATTLPGHCLATSSSAAAPDASEKQPDRLIGEEQK